MLAVGDTTPGGVVFWGRFRGESGVGSAKPDALEGGLGSALLLGPRSRAPVMGALRTWSLSGERRPGAAAGWGRHCSPEPVARRAQVLPPLLESVSTEICGARPPASCFSFPSLSDRPGPVAPVLVARRHPPLPWVISSSARKSPETARSRAPCAAEGSGGPAWHVPGGGFGSPCIPGDPRGLGWVNTCLSATSHVWRDPARVL